MSVINNILTKLDAYRCRFDIDPTKLYLGVDTYRDLLQEIAPHILATTKLKRKEFYGMEIYVVDNDKFIDISE